MGTDKGHKAVSLNMLLVGQHHMKNAESQAPHLTPPHHVLESAISRIPGKTMDITFEKPTCMSLYAQGGFQ